MKKCCIQMPEQKKKLGRQIFYANNSVPLHCLGFIVLCRETVPTLQRGYMDDWSYGGKRLRLKVWEGHCNVIKERKSQIQHYMNTLKGYKGGLYGVI